MNHCPDTCVNAFADRGGARVFPDTVIASPTRCKVIHVQMMNIMFRNSCRPKNHTFTRIAKLCNSITPTVCILVGPTVFRGPRNFEPSRGIWPLPRNFRISAEFHGILRKHKNSEATAKFRKSVLL